MADLASRLEKTFATLDRLERHEGHLLNWYDTRTLEPLLPRYVSTVDSGNLAGVLVAVAQGLKGLADGREDGPHWPGLSDTADRLSAALEAAPRELPLPNGGREGLRHVVHQLHEAVLDASEARRRVLLASLAAALRWATPEAGTGTAAEAALHLAARDLARNVDALLADPIGEPDAELRSRLLALAARAEAFVAEMDFRFLYDAKRRLFAIGYRLADAEGPGRLDVSRYDLLASEARLASFLAIAKGEVPQEHWFHLGRPLTSVDGAPVLLSWSATVFEYLMPLLLMRRYPGTLLDRSCTPRGAPPGAVRREPQGALGHLRVGVRDRRPLGPVPVQGLRRAGPGPEARARRTSWWSRPMRPRSPRSSTPSSRARNLQRLAELGLEGPLGFYEAVDYTPRKGDSPLVATAAGGGHRGARLPRPPPGHDARSRSRNVLRDAAMVRRFHSDGRVQATELLLQERVPRRVVVQEPRPAEESRVATPQGPMMARRFRSPHTAHPHAHFLSNGAYTVIVTNAGGGASLWRGSAVTRLREDATARPGRHLPLPARRAERCRLVGRATSPTRREPDELRRDLPAREGLLPRRGRRHRDAARDRGLAGGRRGGAPRSRSRTASARPREIEVTSYAELVLGPPGRRPRAPGVRQAVRRDRATVPESYALLCPPPAAARSTTPALYGVHVLSVEGRMQGAVEWETDRERFLGRGPRRGRPRRARRPAAHRHDGRRARSDREPAPPGPHRAGRLGARLVRDRCRDRPRRRATRSRRSTTIPARRARTFALATRTRR